MIEPVSEALTRSVNPCRSASAPMIGAVVLGAIGYGLDKWLGTRPWLAILGLVVGAVIALIGLLALMGDRARS